MTTSPCIKVCQIDEAARVCRGCGRTLREIGGWGGMNEAERLAIMAMLPERLKAMGAGMAPPPAPEPAR